MILRQTARLASGEPPTLRREGELTNLEPQSRAIVEALNASGLLPFRQRTPAEIRALMESVRPPRPAEPEFPMAEVFDERVATADGEFGVRVMKPRPTAPDETMPAVIYYHGGGFFMGDLDQVDELARRIAAKANAVVINVDYRLSPEAKFPVAVNDAYASLVWTRDNAARLGIDPTRIALCGDSAGGNLVIVTCLMARERGGPAITFQAPIYPSVDLRGGPPQGSRLRLGGGGLILDNDDIAWMLTHYLGDPAEGADWRASPIAAESFAHLPPALVVTADHDPLVDEGQLYADRLKAAGVEVEYACFEGTFHGFVGYAGVIEIGTRGADLVCDRLAEALRR